MEKESNMKMKDYTVTELFQNCTDTLSLYELVENNNGKQDLRILAANQAFADLISADLETLSGRLFTDACKSALDWLPFYIETAVTGVGSLNESYNYDLKKYLCCKVFSPQIGQVAMLVIDKTNVWDAEQKLRGRDKDLSLLFSSMSSGLCMGKLIRNDEGKAVDVFFEMVNSSFEILEGFPTATMQGKRLYELKEEDPYFDQYIEIIENRTKGTFHKYIPANNFTLEVVCYSHGNDLFVCIENDISARVKAEKELQESHEMIMSSLDYASKIQKNLLPEKYAFEKAFQDYSILWKPRDLVGGDIYWIKNFEGGTILCICDCTGHGTPGALLTMLVASIFETSINEMNYKNTAEIIYLLDQRLISVLNVDLNKTRKGNSLNVKDGCDLAVLFIDKNGSVHTSAGNMHVFVCDGKEVRQVKGQRIFVGEGGIKSPEDIRTISFPADPNNKFYIASDGLFDQAGGEPARPFGYQRFKKILLQNHNQTQRVISEKVWNAYESYRGRQIVRDDVELISFYP